VEISLSIGMEKKRHRIVNGQGKRKRSLVVVRHTKAEVFSGDLFGVEDEKANRADTGAVLSATDLCE